MPSPAPGIAADSGELVLLHRELRQQDGPRPRSDPAQVTLLWGETTGSVRK